MIQYLPWHITFQRYFVLQSCDHYEWQGYFFSYWPPNFIFREVYHNSNSGCARRHQKILKLFISHYSVMYNLVDIGNDNIKYDNNNINVENSSLLFNQKIWFIFFRSIRILSWRQFKKIGVHCISISVNFFFFK